MNSVPCPTDSNSVPLDSEHQRWSSIYAGERFYYGSEPGPVARRAVRYHRSFLPDGGSALDAGCGEGQDLAFLAERGYEVTGLDFTAQGVEKAQRLLRQRSVSGFLHHTDLRKFSPEATFDLVIAVNVLQFLGREAEFCLEKLMAAVSPGGVIGLSLFAREAEQPAIENTIFRITLADLLAKFSGWQPIEAAQLWQWNLDTGQPQPFVTLIARNTASKQLLQLS